MRKLVDIFDLLPQPQGGEHSTLTFCGAQIPDMLNWHVCKDSRSNPTILVAITNGFSDQIPASIVLENLRIDYNLLCRISVQSGRPIEGRFTVIHCLSSERAIHEYFLIIMEAIVRSLPSTLYMKDLTIAVDALVELFHSLTQTPMRSIQGLWAELFLILHSSDPVTMLDSWHSEVDERFDFSVGHQRVEVKSSGDRTRQHHFSMEQAYPPEGTDVLIASIFVERSTIGVTLGELWANIRELSASNINLRMKLENICMGSLGSSWPSAIERAFDEQLAKQSLAFFKIRDIPRVPADLPAGISNVRFRSDISFAKPVDLSHYKGQGRLFDAFASFRSTDRY